MSRTSWTDSAASRAAATRALGVRTQQAPGLGQLEAAADTREQRHAELGLEPADLLGQARLGHEQRFGGSGEGAVINGGQKIGELLKRYRRNLLTL